MSAAFEHRAIFEERREDEEIFGRTQVVVIVKKKLFSDQTIITNQARP